MWFIQPKQDFIAEMPWKYTNENAVVSWQIKARNYNTSGMNFILIPMVLVSLGMAGGGAYIGFVSEVPMAIVLLFGIVMLLIFIPLSLSITHYTTIFIYRFTETVVEVHSWEPREISGKAFLKWSAIILLPVVVVLALFEPALILAGIGPLGMGLMALQAGSQQAKQNSIKHHSFYWQDANKIYLYPGRDIIGLNVPWYNPEEGKIMPKGIRRIYCKKGEREEVLNFFKAKLPDVEVVEEKFHLR
ncbi:hypothetical protein B0H98_1172 [Vreelandella songnenensis]|uniref:Uncharacterized protein n=1 Tax=Vreelandella songnenensis TaxID=1176243 RepID=A0A2T0ULL5_9GAMM|nr:hypothetical protein [Halomonas songnenensis]PRY58810.1 hypothetical protein B0H98_1172 [Halomonas songnenensis]